MDNNFIITRWREYKKNPLLWVEDFFEGNLCLSNQQKEALQEFSFLVCAKMDYAEGKKLSAKQEEYVKKIGISIMSGKGSGKDFFAAMVIVYFLCNFNEAHVMGTANTAKQLRNVLWREISKIMGLAKPIDPKNPNSLTLLQHLLEWQAEKVCWREKDGQSWFAEAVTISPHASSDEQAKALTGRHADFMFIVADEAAGIPETAFDNLESTLSGKVNLILVIFNPFKTTGYAVNSQYKDKSKWVALRWNTEDTVFADSGMTRAIQARNDYLIEKYGRDGNPYRVQVLGLPPLAATDCLIPWDWVMDAVERPLAITEEDVVVMGIDPAAGGDKSVIVTRKGGTVIKITRFNLADTMAFTGRVMQEIEKVSPDAIMVDPIGVGKGVFDRIKELGYKVHAVDVRRTPYKNPEKYDKLRDELWWTLREQFEKGIISIPKDEDLIGQIACVKSAEPTSSGKEKVMSKKGMRKGLDGNSPDEADALMITYAYEDMMFRKAKNKGEVKSEYNRRKDHKEHGWLGA